MNLTNRAPETFGVLHTVTNSPHCAKAEVFRGTLIVETEYMDKRNS